MKVSDLRNKSAEDLTKELLSLRKEQFNLRMKKMTGQLNQNHLLGAVKKNIARVKTVLNEKAGE